MPETMERYTCDEANAAKIAEWIRTRGGIMIWQSINLSNDASWTTPATHEDNSPATKPNWQSANEPKRHITDIADVDVTTAKEYKRFHVAVRMGDQGLSLKVTDSGSRRIRKEVAKAKEETGKDAWYEFDYGATEFNPQGKNCVIMVEDARITMTEWLAKQATK